jgi:hypothetical protein
MTLMNRLAGDWHRHPFVTIHKSGLHGAGENFAAVLEYIGSHLYRGQQSSKGIVFLTPYDAENNVVLDFMAIAETVEAAKAEADAAMTILIPPSPTHADSQTSEG